MPILFAGVEHRTWVMAFVASLNGLREPPPLDPHSSRFGAWLVREGLAGRATPPALLIIAALHQQIHALAAELLDLQTLNRASKALARLGELYVLRDRLQVHLAGLLR